MSYVVTQGGGKDPAGGVRMSQPDTLVGYFDEWNWRYHPCFDMCGLVGVLDVSDCPDLLYLGAYGNQITRFVWPAGGGSLTAVMVDVNPLEAGQGDFSGWTVLEKLYISNTGEEMGRVNVTGCTALLESYCAYGVWEPGSAPGIDGLDTCPLINSVYCEENGWGADEVDNVLVDLDASGAGSGYATLNGNTPPGSAGLAAKSSLESKGWTVTVDS